MPRSQGQGTIKKIIALFLYRSFDTVVHVTCFKYVKFRVCEHTSVILSVSVRLVINSILVIHDVTFKIQH